MSAPAVEHDARNTPPSSTSKGQPATDDSTPDDLDRFLALLSPGRYGVGHQRPGEAFRGSTIDLSDVRAAVDSIGDASTWLSVSQVDPAVASGRGTKRDMRRLVALPVDFDVKAEGGFGDWSAIAAAINDLSRLLGTPPAVVVATGHGLQPWWLLDPDDDAWACDSADDPRWLAIVAAVEGQWRRLVLRVCAEHGGSMDSVFDVSRIMRLPGTVNTKYPDAPVDVTVPLWRDDWTPLSFTAFTEALDGAGAPELEEDSTPVGDVVTPGAQWPWPEATCPYARKAVEGFTTDGPNGGRHGWLLSKAVRLTAMARYGCLTPGDYTQAVDVLRARFLSIVADPKYGTPRQEGFREVDEVLRFAVRKVESWTDDQVAGELTTKAGDLHDHEPDYFGEWLAGEREATHTDGQDSPGTEPDGPSTRLEDAVFGATPELTYIRALARERMVSPWALLSGCLALVIATTHPDVHTPAFVGGKGSLNLGVAVAGPSGSGKSAVMSVALEVFGTALALNEGTYMNPSSGEGILAMFVSVDSKGVQTQTRERVVSLVDEIGTMAAQSGRQGSTLMSMLRTAISGGLLSTHAADRSRQRRLEPHTYRWCLLVGVQPGTARYFLDDKDEGTPQRFLWMPSTDPAADADAPPVGASPFRDWKLGPHTDVITFPPGVRDHVRQAQQRRNRGRGDSLDGHAVLTRIKVAAGLALLHRTTTVSEPMWDIAGHVMAVSDRTRNRLLDHAEREAMQAATRQGRVSAARDEARDEARVERCALVVARRVQGASGPLTRRQVKDAAGRYRNVWKDGLDRAIERGWVAAVEVPGTSTPGAHYASGRVAL